MKISSCAKVVLDSSIKTFDRKIFNFIETQAKPAIEKSFNKDLRFCISRQTIEGPILNGRQSVDCLTSELTINASKRNFLGFIKRIFNPVKETTNFRKIDEKLFSTLSNALKALNDPDSYKYTIEEVLQTASKAVSKLK